MITQSYLNTELDLAARTFLYYSDYLMSYSNVGSDKLYKWYIDSMQLDVLSGALKAVRIEDDAIYIGNTEITLNFYKLLGYKVREYYKSDIDSLYPAFSIIDPADIDPTPGPITPPTTIPYLADWKELVITITVDTTTSITLPFNWDNIDPESFTISVEDGSPLKSTSGAYYIEDNILYWQYYYDLNAGDKVFINYLQIKGV